MKLRSKDTAIAYRCPSCGDTVFGIDGIFTLTGDLFRIKCSCDKGSEAVLAKKDGKVAVQAPCPICGTDHRVIIDPSAEFSSDPVISACPVSGVPFFYVGTKKAISERAADDTGKLLSFLEECGVGSIPELSSIRSGAKKETYEYSVGTDELLGRAAYLIAELEEEGGLSCGCAEGRHVLISAEDGKIIFRCEKCGRSAFLPANVLGDPYLLAEIVSLKLE